MSQLKNLARKGLDTADRLALALDRGSGRRAGSLVPVLFHALYENDAQLADVSLAPNQDVTVAVFRSFVAQMLESGYMAVSPAQVDAGLDPAGRYLMITFDDGYFNNTLATGVLAEFRVPATFFISSDHVRQRKAFWWDAFSRELTARGVAGADQRAHIEAVKRWTAEEIEAWLLGKFGERVLEPRGDLDRPFTPGELRQFAASPWVHLGNHTRNHAILTRYEAQAMASQVAGCQQALAEMAGYKPIAIAYPNGNVSPGVVQGCADAGLRLGFTVVPERARLPLAGGPARMAIGRFLFHGGRDLRRQCRSYATRFVPSHWVRSVIRPAG